MRSTERMMYKNRFAPLLFGLLFVVQCSRLIDQTENRSGDLLLRILLESCTIGDQSFLKSGNIACLNGTATGTGTLVAAAERDTFVSMLLHFSVMNGGSLDALAFANRTDLAGTGVGVRMDGTTAVPIRVGVTDSFATAQNATSSLCIEIHNEAGGHVMVNSACSGTENDKAFLTGSTQGNSYGFVLTNATVSGLSLNTEEIWGEP